MASVDISGVDEEVLSLEERKQLGVLAPLYELWERMETHKGLVKDANMIERWAIFSRDTTRGVNCAFSRKCQRLFFEHDFQDTKRLLQKALEAIERYESLAD